jgi:hypothetical protein
LCLTLGLVGIFLWSSLGWAEGLSALGMCGGRSILLLVRRGDNFGNTFIPVHTIKYFLLFVTSK